MLNFPLALGQFSTPRGTMDGMERRIFEKIQPKSCEIKKECLPLQHQNRMIMTFDDITNDGRLWAGGHTI